MKSLIEIRKISITELGTDAIVNAANEHLAAGSGVCGAIFSAAGYDELQKACSAAGHCDTGKAVITPGFKCKSKYIIHAVGPVWRDGNHGEPELLRSAYINSLMLAVKNNCRSIGFPLLSSGVYGYPVQDAWHEALSACRSFLDGHPDVCIDIVFAVLSDDVLSSGIAALISSGASKYKIADKNDWNTKEMPGKCDTFILHRAFSPAQMEALKRGHIPQEMEDKWFWYTENGKLFAHRSWTGICIYIIEFNGDGNHRVTVNRDPAEYGCNDIEEDVEKLNNLLDRWTQSEYDYYSEWLSETADMIKRSEKSENKLTIGGSTFDAVFFYKPDEPYGFLSNWYISPFVLDGVRFTSSEQFIMYKKCVVFGDWKSAGAVLKTDDPAKQRKIGRAAKGYIQSVWEGMRQMIAYEGLTAKFSQNDDLKQKLLDTGDAILVECSGTDKIWACGLRLSDKRRFDASYWKGTNILGNALMTVRSQLRRQ